MTRVSGVHSFCLGGTHAGVGRVGLGPPVGFSPLFTLEFSQQKKNFSAEITMSTLPNGRSGERERSLLSDSRSGGGACRA